MSESDSERFKESCAQDGDGKPIHPAEGSFPILHRLGPTQLIIVGTGFWISRYGLFFTAGHVVDELIEKGGELSRAYAFHWAREGKIHLRVIRSVTRLHAADLAIGQADNYVDKFPDAPLPTKRAKLTTSVPAIGSKLVTFAYPENEVLEFSGDEPPVIRGDRFEGVLLRNVTKSDHPYIPYPYLETSIEVRSGASGGPVFDDRGRVVGVNCRGWDFRGTEHEDNPLSSIVPIGEAMPMEVPVVQLPSNSWEGSQVPAARRGKPLTLAELAAYGHVAFEL